MDRIVKLLSKPGAKGEIQGVAPTQYLPAKQELADAPDASGYVAKSKSRKLDVWLDLVVRASGSTPVFLFILAGLLTWALLGIKYGTSDSWQVLISDIQAIVSYFFDSLLVRQQLNAYEEEMVVAAELQSRMMSHRRMLAKFKQKVSKEHLSDLVEQFKKKQSTVEGRVELPPDTWLGRLITRAGHILGHLGTVGLYWVGVFVWIGIGHLYNYGDRWQLYMNSASSALMVFVFAFLAYLRERHGDYNRVCLDAIFNVDSRLELQLRSLTGDMLENDVYVIPAPKVNRIQRAIFYYLDFVGTLVGIAILLAVIVVWVAIGPLFHFDSNWWLLIGTYAGLIGMNDGFMLRNMQARLRTYVDAEFANIHRGDDELFAIVPLPVPNNDNSTEITPSLTKRMSEAMNRVCAHEFTVIAGILTIVGLIAGASAMRWSLTGQLLCNVPPSLIESFFMIILITGHNAAEDQRIMDLHCIHERRLHLMAFVDLLMVSSPSRESISKIIEQ